MFGFSLYSIYTISDLNQYEKLMFGDLLNIFRKYTYAHTQSRKMLNNHILINFVDKK